jgi:DnaB helicase-like protein
MTALAAGLGYTFTRGAASSPRAVAFPPPSPRSALADLDAERAMLGGLLIFPDQLPGVIAAGVQPATFASPGHGATFKGMVRLGPEGLTAPALVGEIARAGDLALVGGPAALVGFTLTALEVADEPGMWGPAVARLPVLIPMMAERLRMLAGARRVQRALCEAQARVERDPVSACEVLAGLPRSL